MDKNTGHTMKMLFLLFLVMWNEQEGALAIQGEHTLLVCLFVLVHDVIIITFSVFL